MNKEDNYEDIINLKRPVSQIHNPMSMKDRAAQFAPFAALTGYDENIKETARLTDKRIEISDEEKNKLNDKLQMINKNLDKESTIEFTYFIYDAKKSGGKYLTKKGIVKKIDIIKGEIILKDKTNIPINEIINIESEIFKKYQIY